MRQFFFALAVLVLGCSSYGASLPCLGYFNAGYRDANLARIDALKNTSGDVVLFMGDSLTQMWTDTTADLSKPQCSTASGSGLVDWTALPGVKVNLGLYGITSCSYLSEYQTTVGPRLKPFSSRIKMVVINLGTNDIIQSSKDPSAQPSTQVQYLKQLVTEMATQLPQAHFLVHTIPPCLNAACGTGAQRETRVAAWNAAVYTTFKSMSNTVVQTIPIKPSDLTLDQIHYNTCAYRKISHNVKFWASAWMTGYTYPTSLPVCAASTPIHPCDLSS